MEVKLHCIAILVCCVNQLKECIRNKWYYCCKPVRLTINKIFQFTSSITKEKSEPQSVMNSLN